MTCVKFRQNNRGRPKKDAVCTQCGVVYTAHGTVKPEETPSVVPVVIEDVVVVPTQVEEAPTAESVSDAYARVFEAVEEDTESWD